MLIDAAWSDVSVEQRKAFARSHSFQKELDPVVASSLKHGIENMDRVTDI